MCLTQPSEKSGVTQSRLSETVLRPLFLMDIGEHRGRTNITESSECLWSKALRLGFARFPMGCNSTPGEEPEPQRIRLERAPFAGPVDRPDPAERPAAGPAAPSRTGWGRSTVLPVIA